MILVTKGFGAAQQHYPVRIGAVVKQPYEFLLQLSVHIYQQVATR